MIQLKKFKVTTGNGALVVKESAAEHEVVVTTPSGVISVSEFADQAGITSQAVRKMIAEGRLHAKKIGKQHTVPLGELNRYLQTQ